MFGFITRILLLLNILFYFFLRWNLSALIVRVIACLSFIDRLLLSIVYRSFIIYRLFIVRLLFIDRLSFIACLFFIARYYLSVLYLVSLVLLLSLDIFSLSVCAHHSCVAVVIVR